MAQCFLTEEAAEGGRIPYCLRIIERKQDAKTGQTGFISEGKKLSSGGCLAREDML